ncbi:autotransporter outer membrane beta-barrel domain-containing protein [Pollutimonas harenae]|uniref:Autotransporter outer membrane beta-barrel domain-containing protein n=1 Tax=Pollutimonas harenae TaxID=657015 RepID=A0A853GYP1_9BURK|nr:autotransporter outer membrane beta-barrel domain-containing protein [Pollutimonas harenae]NYT84175.1 autotransporter outer membrane beta-barrel domain-containing protein [Pollutimonas harenae]TEA73409.1 autotransporter outer membrane beta-barrel domain-containing protein [Pollutimonas harenae]
MARFTGPAGSTDIRSDVGGTSMELAVGATLSLTDRTHLYAEVGKLWDTGGSSRIKSGLNGSVGVRVAW